eukprot:4822530-Pyramimonas_sp.AAC.1
MRNLALGVAATSHVFVCDADMLPSADLCPIVTDALKQMLVRAPRLPVLGSYLAELAALGSYLAEL